MRTGEGQYTLTKIYDGWPFLIERIVFVWVLGIQTLWILSNMAKQPRTSHVQGDIPIFTSVNTRQWPGVGCRGPRLNVAIPYQPWSLIGKSFTCYHSQSATRLHVRHNKMSRAGFPRTVKSSTRPEGIYVSTIDQLSVEDRPVSKYGHLQVFSLKVNDNQITLTRGCS